MSQAMGETSFEQSSAPSSGMQYSSNLVNEIVSLHSSSTSNYFSSRSTARGSESSNGSLLSMESPLCDTASQTAGTVGRSGDWAAPAEPVTDDVFNHQLSAGLDATGDIYSDSINRLVGSQNASERSLSIRDSSPRQSSDMRENGMPSGRSQSERTVRNAGLPPTAKLMRDLWEHGDPAC